jgi:hypothetical protein
MPTMLYVLYVLRAFTCCTCCSGTVAACYVRRALRATCTCYVRRGFTLAALLRALRAAVLRACYVLRGCDRCSRLHDNRLHD